MKNFDLSQICVIAILLILAGLIMVCFDLSRIYRSWLTLKWRRTTGTVSGVARVGPLYRAINFTYSGFDGYSKQFKSAQTVLRDSWCETLSSGSLIPVLYDPKHPDSAVIEHRELWTYIIFAILNFLWVFLGLLMLVVFR